MGNSKKARKEGKNLLCFARTIKRTGKWRGDTPEEYKKKHLFGFKSGTKKIERANEEKDKYIHFDASK
jgi:hypothetical protein